MFMKKIYSILLCIGLVASFVACEKDKDFALTTLSVANEIITPWYESAQVSCSFKADATISEACVQYALSSSFVEYKTAEMAEEKGVYSAQLIDLQSDTMYYVRYVVSNKYSQVVSEAVVDFRTLQPVVPTVVLDTVSEVWDHRAIAQMRLVFYGGAAVTDMGICWGTQPQPTMKDIHRSTDDTLALIDITSLQPNTKYYARAYAVNKVGVAYSEEKEFVTLTQPEVRTDEVRDIELTSAVLVGKLLFNGNDTAAIKGFCWDEKAVPTVDDDQVAIDTLTDGYSYLLSNLKDETQYFVRAYAKNKIGVVYGEERVFTTQAAVAPKVVTKEVKDVDDQSATVQGEVTSDGGAEVTERGVVYGTAENPTTANTKKVSGSGTGMFTCNLTGLQPNTKYYVRAYAVNKKGTAYGEQVSFTTLEEVSATPEYVDLGLSVKWATFNVGANKPEEYGDYFAWGETEPKEVYDWSTYKWCNGSETTLTKYCTVDSLGTVDNKTQLELSDDAARANWGGSWRMPTDAELTELREQCTWTWTTQNGVYGYKVTSKKSGYTNKSIFLPAAGCRYGSSLYYAGGRGYYWSSSLHTGSSNDAYDLYFSSSYVDWSISYRYYGRSVRPVYGEYVPESTLPVVTTSTITQITETTAVAGGNVTADGGASVTERGVVYGTSENPTVGNSKVVGGSGTGMFTCNLTGLQPNTKYYVRAYAVNKKDTVYGEQVNFTTLTPIVVPTVMTHVITQIAETTAVAGGNVTADGGASVTERGVVYGTAENPTTANSKVVGGSGTGTFTCNLADLQPNTKYYVRAYAVNSQGTAYGEQVSFTTLEEVSATPEYVDLGLSVKWADRNVGATKPEEYGDYFAWGETAPKEVYDWSTYIWCNGSYTTQIKYCTNSSYGTVDNKTQLELSDDAAHANWGGDWRMPTQAEQDELINNCTWTWTTQNGVNGYKVTSKSNGNSIFLPAAGRRYGGSLDPAGSSGYYWSSSLNMDYPNGAWYVKFSSDGVYRYDLSRYYGFSVRPVYGEYIPAINLPVITTGVVTQITETTAVAGGNVTADGGASVTERGVVYGTSENPTTANSKVVGGSGTGMFTCNLTGLQPNTKYYVRAYAVNKKGTVYGEQVSFTTLTPIVVPTVMTHVITQIAETTAVAGGNVTADGGASVTERGVVYGISENPTVENSKVTSGAGIGAFTCNLADLQAGTTYYVRAYAINERGTAYGEQVSFTTLTPSNGMENGYEWVDLGLSVKWATINVGATKPEEYGDYFAWGETAPKEVYDRSTYKWCNGSETTLTKYCTDDSLGIVDNKTQLELSDDAARVNWGGSWRMPTDAELTELRENCTWTWTTQNGVNGYKVTSKSNGNSIFLPAAGHRYNSSLSGAGSHGDYWSSSLYTDYPHSAWHVYFYPGYVNREGTLRSSGFSVRPVYGEYVPAINLPMVTTSTITQITETTAVAGGNVTADGGASVTERGVVYSTTANPTTANTKKVSGSGTGAFTCNLTGLQASTTYYVRAYAINEKGTAYGEQVSFTTLTPIVPPTVTTSAVTQITETTAVAGGNVTADGGASVTERGVVYGTAENPTTASGKVVNGSGTGAFTCNLTGLQPNTKYYVRAYAVNSQGTAYGEQVSFTTLEEVSATPEYVDLGLSVKWATFNVGATKPEEYGDYFAWGETAPKEVYDWSTYKWCNGSETTLTKYCTDGSYGTVDNKTQLELSDDAAHANWGGSWRMPTQAEQNELREQCTWTWTTQNGVNGYKVTSKSNGNSIFLPAAGRRYRSSLNSAGSIGYCWSSSLVTDDPSRAYELGFTSGYVGRNYDGHYLGQSVRPVYGEYVPESTLPVVTTGVVTQITETTAVAGGNVTSDGGASVTERGVVYGTAENPTVENSKVVGGSGTGAFTCNLADLQAGTTYYVRAYAMNSQGTAYGEQVSFTTLTPSNGMENGYEWVDLGLSVKWATINVGATKPEEYGDYFAWGETAPKEVYDWSTKWCNGSETTLTKYCTDGSYGTVDNKTQLELSDDAAHANWGGSWRMPTDAEQDELRNNCTWTWTTQNGVNGYKVTGTNGNSIFLPAAGNRSGSSLGNAGSGGFYWSSSLGTDDPSRACGWLFNSDSVRRLNLKRYYGQSVRPVCP